MDAPDVDCLARIKVVLVEPKSPGNVGSTARVCANAGLGGLDVAGAPEWQDERAYREEALRMARHAAPLVDAMRRFEDLPSAIAGAAFVVGTSVRPTGAQRLATPRSAAPEILERAARGPVALVFGREDRGLSVEEIALCDLRLVIPSSADYPAWNLSHAVAVVAAAVREEAAAAPRPQRPFTDGDLGPALHASLERLYAELERMLLDVGFLDPANPDRIMADLRRVLGSRGLSERDARILQGMVRQIEWALRQKGRHADG